MKVLVVLNSLEYGNIELMFLKAIPLIAQEGIHIDLCCIQTPSNCFHELNQDFRNLGCRIHQTSISANPLRTASSVARLIKNYQYDLVHSQHDDITGGVALGVKRAGVPHIISLNSIEPTHLIQWKERRVLNSIRSGLLQWHRHLIRRWGDFFIGHSKATLDHFNPNWQNDPGKFRMIQGSASFPKLRMKKDQARRQLGIPLKRTLLLHVGNFRQGKNYHGLLQILNLSLKNEPSALLMLVGDGYQRSIIEKDVEAMGLQSHVLFIGSQHSLDVYYAAADVFVFPSDVEGICNVLLESQGAALPIVASDVSAHRESVAPMQHRFLFPLYDYERAAKQVLQQLVAARRSENSWVYDSLQYVQGRFCLSRFVQDIASTYESVRLADRPSS